MSNKNYKNYSKMSAPENVVKDPVDIEEVVEEPASTEVEPTNNTADATPVTAVDPEPEVTAAPPVNGVVVNCERLRVRKLPNKDSEVLGLITEGSKVQINLDNSTINWYAVYTAAGLEGYCMKKYISTK